MLCATRPLPCSMNANGNRSPNQRLPSSAIVRRCAMRQCLDATPNDTLSSTLTCRSRRKERQEPLAIRPRDAINVVDDARERQCVMLVDLPRMELELGQERPRHIQTRSSHEKQLSPVVHLVRHAHRLAIRELKRMVESMVRREEPMRCHVIGRVQQPQRHDLPTHRAHDHSDRQHDASRPPSECAASHSWEKREEREEGTQVMRAG